LKGIVALYAPSVVPRPDGTYRIFFGGWDGTTTGNDRIYSVITRDFTPALAERPAGQAEGTLALKLIPHTPQEEYDWLIIVVDPASLSLRGLVTADSQGGTSSFTFANLKENVGLADKLFTFTPPRGVEVVNESSKR